MAKVKMVNRHIHGDREIKCRECGEIAKEATRTISLKMPYCGDCGKRIDDAAQKYCGHCGEKLDWEEDLKSMRGESSE